MIWNDRFQFDEVQAIFERNADRLVNANTIYEGQVIVLPAKKAQAIHITKA